MSDRTAVLVTGSRDWTEYKPIRDRLSLYPPGTILLHGAATGADTIADDIGRARQFNNWALPYFADLGKRGGPERNDTMGDVLEVLWRRGFRCSVEGFPIGRSPGTRGCLFSIQARMRRTGAVWSVCVTEGK